MKWRKSMSEHSHPIEILQSEFEILRKNHRFITGEVRNVSAKVFRQMPKESTIIFSLCEELLELRICLWGAVDSVSSYNAKSICLV